MHIEKCSINIKFVLNIYQRKRKKKQKQKKRERRLVILCMTKNVTLY